MRRECFFPVHQKCQCRWTCGSSSLNLLCNQQWWLRLTVFHSPSISTLICCLQKGGGKESVCPGHRNRSKAGLCCSLPECTWRLDVCVSPRVMLKPNPYMAFGGEAFGRGLYHEGGTHMNGIDTLLRRDPENSLAPFTMWGRCERTYVNVAVSPHQTLNPQVP